MAETQPASLAPSFVGLAPGLDLGLPPAANLAAIKHPLLPRRCRAALWDSGSGAVGGGSEVAETQPASPAMSFAGLLNAAAAIIHALLPCRMQRTAASTSGDAPWEARSGETSASGGGAAAREAALVALAASSLLPAAVVLPFALKAECFLRRRPLLP